MTTGRNEHGDLEIAWRYAETSTWQYERGMALLGLRAPAAGDSVLDIGCGTGGLTFELGRRVGAGCSVIGIDPDGERLAVARAAAPEGMNVHFIETVAEDLRGVADASVDFVYSNYAFHWVVDKPKAMAELMRCMRPGATAVVEAVGTPGKPQIDMCLIAGPDGQRRIDRFLCLSESGWAELIRGAGFVIEHIDWPVFPFDFASFEVFVTWWESTTQGEVMRSKIPADELAKMAARYPDRVQYTAPSIQFIARKPS